MTVQSTSARLDRLARIAAVALDVPLALVVLGDDAHARLVAANGDAPEAMGTLPFWVRLLRGSAPVVVEDASLDPRFARHPAVAGAPGLRFVAAMPLLDRDGRRAGSLCVAGCRPQRLTPAEHATLVEVAGWAQQEIQAVGPASVTGRGIVQSEDPVAPTALVVEDDPELRTVLGTLLAQDGIGVETAGDLAEAKVALRRRRPAVVLVDLRLPDGDGSDLVRWMQQDPTTAAIPVFVFTGSIDDDRRRELESCNVVVNEKGRVDAAALSAAIASAVTAATALAR